jgi:hypothetical protein
MQTYSTFRPTGFDPAGICLPDNQDWLVAPCGVNRDSDALTRSNWECQLKALGGESEIVQVHRFGHWACGWFEIVLIDPAALETVKLAEELEAALENYPVIDDEHFSQTEHDEADEVWRNCYRERERVEYIRKHRDQFEFRDWQDLIGCVRGKYFAGYASELLN